MRHREKKTHTHTIIIIILIIIIIIIIQSSAIHPKKYPGIHKQAPLRNFFRQGIL